MSSRSGDNGLLACRSKQVSERIYKNHLKTRFSNIQERHKLATHISELDRQEKGIWRELNHKKKALEERFQRIVQAREAALKSSISSHYRKDSCASNNSSKSSSSLKKLEPVKRKKIDRKPSYTSLLTPFVSDKMEYEHVLGYAQHMTKKQTRKSSTVQEDIGLSDISEMKKNLFNCQTRCDNFHSKEKIRLIRGLEKRTKRANERTTVNRPPPSRRISTLPPAVLEEVEENGPRYIRIPECRTPSSISKSRPSRSSQPELDSAESPTFHRPASPKLTYEDQLKCVDGVVTKDSIKLPQVLLLPSDEQYNKYNNVNRRGSKSMSAIEMMKYLPPQTRCLSVENHTLADKVSLFQARMEHMHMRCEDQPDDIEIDPPEQLAPPPRDEYAPRERPTTSTSELREVRFSSVDFYELGKWRQTMAENDHIPEIVRCRYIRKPGRPIYNFKTGRFEDANEDGITLPPLEVVNESIDATRRESNTINRRRSTADIRETKDRRVSSCEIIDINGQKEDPVHFGDIVMMLLRKTNE